MRIVILVPSNRKCGPVNVAYQIYHYLNTNHLAQVEIFCLGLYDGDAYDDIKPVGKINFLKKIFRGEIDLVHTHGLRPDAFMYLTRRISRNPLRWLSTVHIDMNQDMKYNYGLLGVIVTKLWIGMLHNADCVVALNQWLANKYSKFHRLRNVSVVLNGIGFENYVPKVSCSKPIVLGYIGNLIELKNVMILPDLLAELDVKLLIAGTGPLLDDLEKALKLKKINYEYLGHLKNTETFYDSIDVLILPSLTEAMPLVVLEAASKGRPCFLSKLPQYSGVFDGFAVYQENWTSSIFRENFDNLIYNYNHLSHNARDVWLEKFSPGVMALNYFSLYKSLNVF